MNLRVIILVAACFFGSCTTIALGIPEQFSGQATKLHVKGINGFTINQTVQFGDYSSSKIKNGWITTREKDLLLKVFKLDNHTTTLTRTRFQYTLYGDGFESKIFCLESNSAKEREIISNIKFLGNFTQIKNAEYSFSAAILPLIQDSEDPWQLVLYTKFDAKKDTAKRILDLPYLEEEGYASNGRETFNIRTIRTKQMTTQKGKQLNMPMAMPAGYEVRIDDGVVGIIDTYDNNVWIYNELDKETKFILASIASAILLRKLKSSDEVE